MLLRKLELRDAPFMLEWMHSAEVTEFLQANFKDKSIEDCQHFIKNSLEDKDNLHFAIVDSKNEYLGTVSLKNITKGNAEFAIAVRTVAMGRGIASQAMAEVIGYGKDALGLKLIYWCVSPANKRAVKFYDKNHYRRIDVDFLETAELHYSEEQRREYLWYVAEK